MTQFWLFFFFRFRKVRWVVEQDFHGHFWVNVIWFCAFFSCVLDWIGCILVWFERSFHSEHVSRQSCPWPLKLMMSQGVERTWICMGGYRQLRGEWVMAVQTVLLHHWPHRDKSLEWEWIFLIKNFFEAKIAKGYRNHGILGRASRK